MENDNLYLTSFLVVAGLVLLLNIFEGARQGIGRKLASIFGLLAGIAVAFNVGDGPGELLRDLIPYPLMIRSYMGATATGLIVFGTFSLFGILFFKKTKDREDEDRAQNKRWGAIIGGIFAFLSIGLCMLAISISGTLASIFLANQKPNQPNSNMTFEQMNRQAQAIAMLQHLDNLNGAIIDLPGYNLVTAMDPITEHSYRTLDKILQVTNDPEAAERFMQQPRVRSILQDPRLQNLTQDQEIKELTRSRNIHGLLSHPKVRAACEGPAFVELIKDFELENALDAALNHEAIDKNNALIPSDAPYQTVPYAID